jgi:hypothetical protein
MVQVIGEIIVSKNTSRLPSKDRHILNELPPTTRRFLASPSLTRLCMFSDYRDIPQKISLAQSSRLGHAIPTEWPRFSYSVAERNSAGDKRCHSGLSLYFLLKSRILYNRQTDIQTIEYQDPQLSVVCAIIPSPRCRQLILIHLKRD